MLEEAYILASAFPAMVEIQKNLRAVQERLMSESLLWHHSDLLEDGWDHE